MHTGNQQVYTVSIRKHAGWLSLEKKNSAACGIISSAHMDYTKIDEDCNFIVQHPAHTLSVCWMLDNKSNNNLP